MGSLGIPVQERLRVCEEVAGDICQRGAYYVAEVRGEASEQGYLRVVYTFSEGVVEAERVVCARVGDVGVLLQALLRSRTDGLDPSTSIPCWLTVQLPDGCYLRHVLFAISAASAEPQQLLTDLRASALRHPQPPVHKPSSSKPSSRPTPREEAASERADGYRQGEGQRDRETAPTTPASAAARASQSHHSSRADLYAEERNGQPQQRRSTSRRYVESALVTGWDGSGTSSRRRLSDYVAPPFGAEAILGGPREDYPQWPDSAHRTSYFELRDELWVLANGSIARHDMIEDKGDEL